MTLAATLLVLAQAMPAATTPHEDSGRARVVFGARAVPGAVVTAIKADRVLSTVTDADGLIALALDVGVWTLTIKMTGFETVTGEITVPVQRPLATITLRLLKSPEAAAVTPPTTVVSPAAARARSSAAQRAPVVADEANAPATDGFLINGSVNNAAASAFAQPRGFGNNRPQAGSLYTGSVAFWGGDARWDARPYSFGRDGAAAPAHTDVQIQASIGGPIKPWRAGRTAPQFFVAYQGGTRQSATTESLRVPTMPERRGDFSQSVDATGVPLVVIDPATSAPFPGAVIPPARVTPQALALARFFPTPTGEGRDTTNLEAPTVARARQHDLQARVTYVRGRNILLTTVAVQHNSTQTRTPFQFDDRRSTSGVDAVASLNHRFTPRFAVRVRYQGTVADSDTTPAFAHSANVSGDAGIIGNDQTPDNWGPPRLVFTDLSTLSDVSHAWSRARTHAANVEAYLNRGRHTVTLGGDARMTRQDVIAQPDARGTLTFTGAATGAPFADFLLGLPTTSTLAAGNPDRQFLSRAFTAYVSDDARVRPTVTLTLGLRWEVDVPVTESMGRLANLDVGGHFVAVQTVTALDRIGPLSSRRFGPALVTPDYALLQPRAALAWRPIAGSSFLIRAGFGVYRNAGMSASLATALSQQPPISRTVSAVRTDAVPLTIDRAFVSPGSATAGAYAIDQDVRSGYNRTWQVSAQRDLPGSLMLSASYLGSQGRRLLQQRLPNSVPPGAANPCGTCPIGFVYLSSTGRASRHAAQVTLRRRLSGGLSASAQYTLARAQDDATTFSAGMPPPGSVMQDWQDPHGEWGPSIFDQRHVLTAQGQYTTGMDARRGRLVGGWTGALFNNWTIAADLNVASGLPFNVIYLAPIPGTAFVGLRPDLTGAAIDDSRAGIYANASAFSTPASGRWGNAGRNALTGPAQFQFDLNVARVFALEGRRTLEWRVDATNVLNRVTFAGLHTTLGSPLFGVPDGARAMRRLQLSARLRF